MKKLLLVFLSLALLVAHNISAQAVVDEKLRAALTDRQLPVEVVVTFNSPGAPSLLDVTLLQQVGITQGLTFQSLPIAGIVATASQVEALASSPRVLSLYLNDSLQLENNAATAITGVNKLRTDPLLTSRNGGLPVSGKGIGILVNDSGIDGTHKDHEFGRNLVQNVLAATNLKALVGILPYTVVENVANTDASGGHGTHVAGIAGGRGVMSQGKYEGVAPGAKLVGYGSGAALLLLDVLSGFDYAITHQAEYNIRVITNSFGTTSDVGSDVNPANPITMATKRCVDRNIVVVFSAGNSGPGSATITGQYKKAPWVIAVGAGDKEGRLASFSSRGVKGKSGSFTMDGKTFTWEDRPTVVSPGVSIISTRAVSPVGVLSTQKDVAELDPAHVPYYTHMNGTSMAAPHVAGIVALMLEANPSLTPYQVKEILQQTATNMPNRESWEVGAGYVNAYAAVDRAYRTTAAYGSTLNLNRIFNSSVNAETIRRNFTIDFNPATPSTNTYPLPVASGTTGMEVSIRSAGVEEETGNPVNLVLVSPSGREYRSGIPVLFAITYNRSVAVASPEPGTWTVKIIGLNNVAFPEKISGKADLFVASGTSGLNDIAGHPAEASIKMAVRARLVDGHKSSGGYKPDELLKRIDLADYLMMGQGIRQHLPVDGSFTLTDVKERNLLAESVVASGAALRDVDHKFAGVMQAVAPGKFSPNGSVNRVSLAYSLVQSLGLQEYALARIGKQVTVTVNDQTLPIEDAADIPAGMEGYVSIALELNLINAYYTLSQGPYDLAPTLHANFKPLQDVTRAEFAVIITRTHAQWDAATQPTASQTESSATSSTMETSALVENMGSQPTYSFPNPFSSNTTIVYSVKQDGVVNVEVFNLQGRRIKTLISGTQPAGNYTVQFDGSSLPEGAYIYRVSTASGVKTNRMLIVR